MSRMKDLHDKQSSSTKDEESSESKVEVMDPEQEHEYLHNDEESSSELQAMGAATADQIADIDKKRLMENGVDDKEDELTPMEVSSEENMKAESKPEPAEAHQKKGESKTSKDGLNRSCLVEELAANKNEEQDKDIIESTQTSQVDNEDVDRQALLNQLKSEPDIENEDEMEIESDLIDYEQVREQLELSTAKWRDQGQDLPGALDLWKTYSSLTRDLSFSLCESLRLILEPTLARFVF